MGRYANDRRHRTLAIVDATLRERMHAMGDKGGKKDKHKSQKQQQSKHDKQAKKKLDNRQAKKPV